MTAASLDDSMINRAAPPGSLRYFSALYAAPETRECVLALFVIDAEIRESAQSVNHDVAHTRLQWWRAEVDRLINGVPQHPAARALFERNPQGRQAFTRLHELLAAADMDLARMTYATARETRAYCSRSGGATTELLAAQLVSPAVLDEPSRAFANRIGVGVRQCEILRDLRRDTQAGRLYLPLDQLDALGLTPDDLRASPLGARTQEALQAFSELARCDLEQQPPTAHARRLRPLVVLAALHRRLLDRINACNYDVAGRIDLGPFEKPWTAWRAARKAR